MPVNHFYLKSLKMLLIFLFFLLTHYSKKINLIKYWSNRNIFNLNKKERNDKNDCLFEYYKNLDIYKYFKYPLISIIIQIKNNTNEKEMKDFFNKLNNFKNRDNIEIVFSILENKIEINNFTKKYFKKLKIIQAKNNFIYKNIFQIIQQCKGKYLIFININDFNLINENFVEDFYNYTNGKIDNIYEIFSEKNNKSYYIIKTKILRNIYDNGTIFANYDELIDLIKSINKPNLNYIDISLCIDNNYLLNAYVAIISILDNKNYYTFISFYILISKDFTEENIFIIRYHL